MKKLQILILLFFLIISLNISAQSRHSVGLELPESVTSNGNRFFVSNQGKDVLSKDGDGFISEIDKSGKIITLKFLPKTGLLNTPKGLVIIGNILYVADIDRLMGYNIQTRKQVFKLDLNGIASLLNDVCKVNDSTIAISDSFKNLVYLVNIHDGTYKLAGHINMPNGLIYDPKTKTLYVCTIGENMNGKGKIYAENLNDSDTTFHQLSNSPVGFLDGIEFIDKNHLLISDWVGMKSTFGRMWMYDLNNHTVRITPCDAGPADIYYDKSTQKVYTPQSLKNDVLVTGIHALEKKMKLTTKRNELN